MPRAGKNKKPSYAAMQVIWLAFCFSAIIYVFMAYLITVKRSSPPFSPNPNLYLFILIAVIISLSCLIFAFILWNKMPRSMIRRQVDQIIEGSNVSDPKELSIGGLALAQTLFVIIASFCEMSVLCGILLVFLGAGVPVMIPFAVATLISLVLFRPGRSFVNRVTRKLGIFSGVRAQ